ncbi:MAG: succinylglutamate desuccinylase/aspartoacylase family protein [Deltaproteobacteria bacterium]
MNLPVQLATHEILGHRGGPHLLITGGVHGDEFEPMAAIRRLITDIDAGELRGRVTLVPVVNEPAFRRGQRTAEDGLDLARTCPGRPDGTLTETIAWRLSQFIRSADLYIDLHTGGTRLTVQPLCGYMLHPDAGVLARQRRMAHAFGLPLIWGTDPSFNGRSLSIARDAGIPAIYAEYLGGGRFDPAGVEAYVRGCLNVMAEFGLLDEKPVLPVQPALVVEDIRPGAGHMQVNHPSPCEGFFEPAVQLGQQVRAEDVLGWVTDLLGRRVEVIRARYTGMVIVLHTFPRIEEGVSVAVVMEMPASAGTP